MGRLTISLPDDLHQALNERAARQGRSIGSIIEESLRLRGISEEASARSVVAAARIRAGLERDEAIKLAVEETRAEREA